MPAGDRTGPQGKGAATGRGLGNCVNRPTVRKPVRTIGIGLGRGRRGR